MRRGIHRQWLLGNWRFGGNRILADSLGERNVTLAGPLVSERLYLISISSISKLNGRSSALAALVKRGVAEVHKASATAWIPECNKQQCDRQHKQEDDQQSDPRRIRFFGLSCRPTVHTASGSRISAVRRRPSKITVTILVTVTHPMAIAFPAAFLNTKYGDVLASLVHTCLVVPTGRPLSHHSWVRNIIA